MDMCCVSLMFLLGVTTCWMLMETMTWMTQWMWPDMWRSYFAGLWAISGAVSSPEPSTANQIGVLTIQDNIPILADSGRSTSMGIIFSLCCLLEFWIEKAKKGCSIYIKKLAYPIFTQIQLFPSCVVWSWFGLKIYRSFVRPIYKTGTCLYVSYALILAY